MKTHTTVEFKPIKKLAFSLIELMISLIIISIIAAAFSPVITKRIKSDVVAVGSAISSIRSDCDEFSQKGGHCSACMDKLCILCDINCTSDQYKNIGKCECENCASKSNGCLSCNSKDCTKCQSGYYLNSEKKCSPCPAGSSCDGLNQTQCEAGFYQDEQGKGDCKPCFTNDGKYSAKGATSCSSCSAGTYPVDKNWEWHWDGQYHYGIACANCPAGYYCPDGKNAIACLASNNKYTNAQNQTSCKSCPAGQFATDDTVNWGANIRGIRCGTCGAGWACPGGDSVPYICPNGTYQDREGQGYCKSSTGVNNCATYSTTSNICSACETYFTLSNGSCVRTSCPSGQYISGGNCYGCPANATCDGGSTFSCNSGYYFENGICNEPRPAGTEIVRINGIKYWFTKYNQTYSSGCKATTTPHCTTKGYYSGCGRYVCSESSSSKACSNCSVGGYTGWRLPSYDEISVVAGNTSYNNYNSLSLCSLNDVSNNERCYNGSNAYGYYYASDYWTSEGYALVFYGDASYALQKYYSENYRSVRCIRKADY